MYQGESKLNDIIVQLFPLFSQQLMIYYVTYLMCFLVWLISLGC